MQYQATVKRTAAIFYAEGNADITHIRKFTVKLIDDLTANLTDDNIGCIMTGSKIQVFSKNLMIAR